MLLAACPSHLQRGIPPPASQHASFHAGEGGPLGGLVGCCMGLSRSCHFRRWEVEGEVANVDRSVDRGGGGNDTRLWLVGRGANMFGFGLDVRAGGELVPLPCLLRRISCSARWSVSEGASSLGLDGLLACGRGCSGCELSLLSLNGAQSSSSFFGSTRVSSPLCSLTQPDSVRHVQNAIRHVTHGSKTAAS